MPRELVTFLDAELAKALLRSAVEDALNRPALHRALEEDGGSAATDEDLLRELAARIDSGRLRLVRRTRAEGVEGGTSDGEKPAAVAKTERAWIRIHVADDETAEPLPEVKLRIRTPDGAERTVTTNAKGDAEIRDLDEGTCDVRSDGKGGTLENTWNPAGTGVSAARSERRFEPGRGPHGIARIEPHRVRAGESLETLAAGAGLPWQELAQFNWGTSDPKKINEALARHVGCTRRDRKGANYVFDDSDEPGLVYLPHSWEWPGLATGATHVLRVQRIELDEIVRGCVRARFVTRYDYPFAGVPCELRAGKAVYPLQETSDAGEVCWDDVPLDDCVVVFRLGGRSVPAAVPWMREKTEAHHVRFMEAHEVLGPDLDPLGIRIRLRGLGYDTLGEFREDTGVESDDAGTAGILADVYDRPAGEEP